MTRPTLVLVFTISAGLIAMGAASIASADPTRPGERRGPPPEAIDACSEATEDAACAFTSPQGDELSGQCLTRREQLVCVPEGHERHRGCARDDGDADDADR